MPRDWDEHYHSYWVIEDPVLVVRAYAWQIPAGPVLDLAGGAGRNASFLARRGHPVVLAEGSGVALERVRAEAGHLPIQTLHINLETEAVELPPGPFSAVVMSYFLHRPLLSRLPDWLAGGGLGLLESFTVTEGERRGSGSSFYWRGGEMPEPPPGLEVRAYGEGYRDGAYRAWAVWRKS